MHHLALSAFRLLADTTIAPATPGGTRLTSGSDAATFANSSLEAIINLASLIGGGIAVIYIIWAGISYMRDTGKTGKEGSTTAAAQARKAITAAVVGIILLVAARLIINLALGINTGLVSLAGGGSPLF